MIDTLTVQTLSPCMDFISPVYYTLAVLDWHAVCVHTRLAVGDMTMSG